MNPLIAHHQCTPWGAIRYTHAAFAQLPLVGFRRVAGKNTEVRLCACGCEVELELGPANDTNHQGATR